jgi:lysine 2,3-aminomutase
MNDPVYKQCFPSPLEMDIEQCDMAGPLAENEESPVPGITHHSPDRVLFQVGNTCRQCTKERKVCDADHMPNRAIISKGIEYIRENPSVHDVLLSGGDPMMLPDDHIDGILTELDDISHVEAVRIGTRVPAVLPCRITDRLVEILKQHHTVRIITHFNHPNEVTVSSHEALRNLTGSGILLDNQCIPLAGVNDSPQVRKNLLEKLIQDHVRPYYLFQDDLSEGIAHFRTSVSKGVEMVENLITHTGGFSMPAFVVSAPGGGKIQVTPNYQISGTSHKVVLRNY